MKTVDPPNQKPRRPGVTARIVLLATVIPVIVGVLGLFSILSHNDGSGGSPDVTVSPEEQTTAVPTTTLDTSAEIVARLRQIFRIRDQAIKTRNVSLLEHIYTVDCPCLKGDSDLIATLKRDHLQWRGIEVSLQVEKVDRINDRLWTVNAVVFASPFIIEKESGEIVRRMPRGRELSRFALSRPTGKEEWLLGQASLVERRG
jgi:hypothetical protein